VDGTYVEVSLSATSETEEALCDFLFSEGALGLVTEEVSGEPPGTRIRASFRAGLSVGPLREKLARHRLALAALGLPVADGIIQVRELPIEDWGHNWKQHFMPLPVGRRLLIAPPWEAGPFPTNRLVIRIEPAMAFGTGHHATTRMCLEELEAFIAEWTGKDGPIVLDAGTGTGILAIAAAALGAPRVVALDTDPEAYEAAGKNLILNRTPDRVQVRQGGLEALDPGWHFHLILANLDTKTVCPLFGALRERLASAGRLIISGVTVEDEEKVGTAARAAGLRVAAHRAEDGWLCLALAPFPGPLSLLSS
jgi:ribosomal protein L11 methyltransferase